jgi:hypothetical protein
MYAHTCVQLRIEVCYNMSKSTVASLFPTFDDAKVGTSERVQKKKNQLKIINILSADYKQVVFPKISKNKNQVCRFMISLMALMSSRVNAESDVS